MSTAAEERAMVARLSEAQRRKLRPHRDRAHWRRWGPDRFYVERLVGEAFELYEKVVAGTASPDEVWGEAADVANFAAMLADRYADRLRDTEAAARTADADGCVFRCDGERDHEGEHFMWHDGPHPIGLMGRG